MRTALAFAFIAALGSGSIAPAATVRYFSGETAEGRLEVSARGLALGTRTGAGTPLDLATVLEISLRKSTVPADTLPAGVILASGSSVADRTIPALDGPTVELGAERLAVPVATLGWLLFASTTREKLEAAPAGQTGALLPNGDFFPGTLLGVKGERVTLNSTIFGPQVFNGKSQLTAVLLHEVKPAPTRFVVTTIHGSRFLADELLFEAGTIIVKDTALGALKLKSEDVAEIRAGTGRYQWLSDLTPARVTPPAGVDPAAAVRVQKGVGDSTPPTISTAANTAVTYAVPPGFTSFSALPVLPANLAGNTRVAFALFGDNRPLFRTPLYGAGEKPAAVHADIRGVRALTIRVETAGPGGAVFGEWGVPMFLR